jgi:hypothetical protein
LGGAGLQKYAPVVGRWRVELKLDQITQTLEFETDGEGTYGTGTGRFMLTMEDGSVREYPAAWSNTDPQKISICGEVSLPDGLKPARGTLLLRTTLVPAEPIKGDAAFIDEAFTMRRGSFEMKRLLGPEQLKRKS